MEIRQGIDDVLRLAFEMRLEAEHIYKLVIVISFEWGSH